jgi:hypothetical protein
MQPERNGHGGVRPWLVSADLLSAFDEKTRLSGRNLPESPFLQLRRSGRYISEILVQRDVRYRAGVSERAIELAAESR